MAFSCSGVRQLPVRAARPIANGLGKKAELVARLVEHYAKAGDATEGTATRVGHSMLARASPASFARRHTAGRRGGSEGGGGGAAACRFSPPPHPVCGKGAMADVSEHAIHCAPALPLSAAAADDAAADAAPESTEAAAEPAADTAAEPEAEAAAEPEA